MTRDPHPTLGPAIRALRDATRGHESTPCSAEDLAARLESLHNLTGAANLLDAFTDVLDHLAVTLPQVPDLTGAQRELTETWIERAGEHLSAVGEALDRAREATGAEWAR